MLTVSEINKLPGVKRVEVIGGQTLIEADCMDVMPTLGRFDAVVTDPPYGVLNLDGEGSTTAVRKYKRTNLGVFAKRAIAKEASWDVAPSDEAIKFILDAGEQAIIWGGNYFNLPPSRAILVWDKEQPWPNFSQVEIAWTNLQRPAALFKVSSSRGAPNKQHPTQKPIAVMEWCLGFIPKAQTILDPFLGSGTTLVACQKLGRMGTGIEIDPDYFDIACRRVEEAARQPDLFVTPPETPTQETLL